VEYSPEQPSEASADPRGPASTPADPVAPYQVGFPRHPDRCVESPTNGAGTVPEGLGGADSAVKFARAYRACGFAPIPVPLGMKAPSLLGWPRLQIADDEVDRRFRAPTNVGLLTGNASGGLVDVDLDCDEAVSLAEYFLPPTPMRSGRPSRPSSHAWYTLTGPAPDITRFHDLDGTCLLEIRGNGGQTLVSPSMHPEGEPYEWEGPFEPAAVHGDELERSAKQLAAAALLVRHWPKEAGSRHDIANAFSGALLRANWSEAEVCDFIGRIARAAGDEEVDDRIRAAEETARTLERGEEATGKPTLARLIGDEVVRRCAFRTIVIARIGPL